MNAEEFFEKIDWALLREQKANLITGIELGRIDSETTDTIDGILCLIDGMQDFMVNDLKYNEMYIFGSNEGNKAINSAKTKT